jgi:RNA polymerase sigma factor (sigma-70 family)
MTGDTELLRQYAETRSEAAFTELVRRHIDFVYAVALRHAHSSHRAEDATQAVFTDLARKAASVGQRAELVGWLYTSARFAAFKIVRSEARRERREREAEMIPAALGATDPAAADWQALRPHLDDALCGLSKQDRSAVLLRCVNGRSFAEVGAELDLSEDAARKRVDRALDRLRGHLARRGIASTAGAVLVALGSQSAVAAPPSLAAAVSHTALAAGSSAPLLAALIHLMSTSKIVATLAVLTGAVAITAAWHETQAAQAAQATQNEAEQAYRRLLDSVGRSHQAALAAERDRADLTSALAGRQTGRPVPAAESDPAQTAAFRAASTDFVRSGVRMDFMAMARYLHLTPEQAAALADIYATSFNTTVNGVTLPGNSAEDALNGRRAIVELLGRAGARQFAAVNRTLAYRKAAAEVAADLGAADALPAPAAEQLAAVLAQNQIATRPDAWPQALAQAADTLSPSQLEVLRTYATSKTGVTYSASAHP